MATVMAALWALAALHTSVITCELPNGDFSGGSEFWTFEVHGGRTLGYFPESGVDGLFAFEADNSNGVGYGISRAVLSREVGCHLEGRSIRFSIHGSCGGQRPTAQKIEVFADSILLGTIQKAAMRWDEIFDAVWPASANTLEVRYTANPCIECTGRVQVDDFQFTDSQVPVRPMTWGEVKLQMLKARIGVE